MMMLTRDELFTHPLQNGAEDPIQEILGEESDKHEDASNCHDGPAAGKENLGGIPVCRISRCLTPIHLATSLEPKSDLGGGSQKVRETVGHVSYPLFATKYHPGTLTSKTSR